MKKIILINLLALALFSRVFTVYAFEIDPINQNNSSLISPAYANIRSCYADLTIHNNTATSSVKVKNSTSKPISIKMTLQKKSNGKWTDVKTWNKSGTEIVELSKSYNVTSGKKYRLKYIVTSGDDVCSGTTAEKTA
ncbi:MAG: hypothetical protein LUF92_12580 [Clostridiales bacterium]|nr:hypothetical protein [Clostridiales bacterium]